MGLPAGNPAVASWPHPAAMPAATGVGV